MTRQLALTPVLLLMLMAYAVRAFVRAMREAL